MRALLIALLFAALAPAARAAHPVEQAMAAVVRIDPADAADGSAAGRPLGAGFLFDARGHVLTAAHVVAGRHRVSAAFEDGRRLPAVVVGRDPLTDIAVLRLAGEGLPPPPPLASVVPRRGEPVQALGHPLGFAFSLTAGVLSGDGRAYDPAWPVDLLQHDAPLNPGSSGGPLVNAAGEVVGMNLATPPEVGLDVGIGLAAPVPVLRAIAGRLIAEGRIARGQAGLTVRAAPPAVVAALGGPEAPGLLIETVTPDGAAAAAGLAPGEVLLALDGRPLARPRDLAARLMHAAPGDRVRLSIVGPEGARAVVLTLGPAPGGDAGFAARPPASAVAAARRPEGAGLRVVRPVDAGPGVLVAEVEAGSPAERAGLRRDDRLLAVNGTTPADAEAVRALLRAAGPLAVLRVRREGHPERHLLLALSPEAEAATSVFDTQSGPL